MAMISHLFAGVTDYFKAYGAKSYSDVIGNASKRFNPTELAAQRAEKVEAFRTKLSQNKNLSPDEINNLVDARDMRHGIGDFIENSIGLVGMGTSFVGGTAGFVTKKTIQAPFKIPGAIKDSANEIKNINQLHSKASMMETNSAKLQEELLGPDGHLKKKAARHAKRDAEAAREEATIAKQNMSHQTKVVSGVGALTGVGGVAGVVKGVSEVGEIAQHAGLTVPGMGGAIKNAIDSVPLMKEVGNRILTNARAGNAADGFTMGIQAISYLAKPMAKATGKGVVEYGRDLGKDTWRGMKWFHENRNSRGVMLAAGAGAIALAPAAYDGGAYEEKYNNKMRQMAENLSVSDDGGGTFLRPNQTPQVENMGATGDLVFALHSLRNGG